MKKFKERVHQYDMRTPLQVPAVYHDILGEDAWEAQWDASNPHRKIIDLTLHWGKLPMDHILKWQREFNGYSSDVDHVSSIWIKDLLVLSMDTGLKKVPPVTPTLDAGGKRQLSKAEKHKDGSRR
jgi:hypothetical protein